MNFGGCAIGNAALILVNRCLAAAGAFVAAAFNAACARPPPWMSDRISPGSAASTAVTSTT